MALGPFRATPAGSYNLRRWPTPMQPKSVASIDFPEGGANVLMTPAAFSVHSFAQEVAFTSARYGSRRKGSQNTFFFPRGRLSGCRWVQLPADESRLPCRNSNPETPSAEPVSSDTSQDPVSREQKTVPATSRANCSSDTPE